MDAEVLRRKAVEKGILDREAAARLDNRDCYNLIFLPGFSTKTEISDVSGRGVGMDVVKTRIAQLNGSVDVDSTPGAGTVIRIRVPLTLAIVPTLMVMLDRQIFAFPLVNVSEIFDLVPGTTHTLDGQLAVQVRNRPLPLFYLRQWGAGAANAPVGDGAHVVVVQVGSQQVGFVVDQLLGQEEVVVKPLGALLHGIPGLAGATITGDGRIALIMDVPTLVKVHVRTSGQYGGRAARAA
jgi:two-component system chemotaxis sensor kinase CheA